MIVSQVNESKIVDLFRLFVHIKALSAFKWMGAKEARLPWKQHMSEDLAGKQLKKWYPPTHIGEYHFLQ